MRSSLETWLGLSYYWEVFRGALVSSVRVYNIILLLLTALIDSV